MKHGHRGPDEPLRAIGYVRVSTAHQVDSGAGIEAQRAAIEQEAARRGWTLLRLAQDNGMSGAKAPEKRPALGQALQDLRDGTADVLVVSRLDRLSRSVKDFATLLERAQHEHWALAALDIALDMSTPAGEAMGAMMATFARYERRVIGARIREALAVKAAQGVKIGRPRQLDLAIVDRIVAERAAGRSLQAIADGLNADGSPTAHGGARWYPSTVHKVLQGAPAHRNE